MLLESVRETTQSKMRREAPEWLPTPTWRMFNMKNRTIFALLLAVILAVPVFAQQNFDDPGSACSPDDHNQGR